MAASGQRPVEHAGHGARVFWLELPALVLLTFVLLASPVGLVAGARWAVATAAAVAAVWAGLLAGRVVTLTRGPGSTLARADVAVALAVVWLSWRFLTGNGLDDPFCHHSLVALIGRNGLPLAAPGGGDQPVAYHLGFDLLAAALRQLLGLRSVEQALDLTSLASLLAVAGAVVALLRRVCDDEGVRALAVAAFFLGGGPLWLSWWLPTLQLGDDLQLLVEGSTWLSPVLLAGRRATLLGLSVGVMTLRLLYDGALRLAPEASSWGRPWGVGALLAVLAGSAALLAEEAALWVALALAAVAWRGGRVGLRGLARPALVMAGAAALVVVAGGFAVVTLGRALGLGDPVPSAGPGWSLTWPAWPSFHRHGVAFPDLGWWRTLALELTPGLLLAPLWWLGRRHVRPSEHPAWRDAWALWWLTGVTLALSLEPGAAVGRHDLHRLLLCSGAVGFALVPVTVWRTSRWRRPQRRLIAALATAPLLVTSLARLTLAPELLGSRSLADALVTGGPRAPGVWLPTVCVAACLCVVAVARGRPKRWLWGAAVFCALALIGARAGDRDHHQALPPPLPSRVAAFLAADTSPVLPSAGVANALLLHGQRVAAPALRDDLEPLRRPAHDAWLQTVDRVALQRLGARRFVLREPDFRRLAQRLPLRRVASVALTGHPEAFALRDDARFTLGPGETWVWGAVADPPQSAAEGRAAGAASSGGLRSQ